MLQISSSPWKWKQNIPIPVLGSINKGASKPKHGAGSDLPYFRFAPRIKNHPDTEQLLVAAWEATFGDKPQQVWGYLTSFNAGYGVREGTSGHRVRACDGVTMEMDNGAYCRKPCECDPEHRDCKAIVFFDLYNPTFLEHYQRLWTQAYNSPVCVPYGFDMGVFQMRTGSWYDAEKLKAAIAAAAMSYPSIHVSQIPFLIMRQPRQVTFRVYDKAAGRDISKTKTDYAWEVLLFPEWKAQNAALRVQHDGLPMMLTQSEPSPLVAPLVGGANFAALPATTSADAVAGLDQNFGLSWLTADRAQRMVEWANGKFALSADDLAALFHDRKPADDSAAVEAIKKFAAAAYDEGMLYTYLTDLGRTEDEIDEFFADLQALETDCTNTRARQLALGINNDDEQQ